MFFFAEKIEVTKYNQVTEGLMVAHFARLSEPLRRQYAYLEAQKLGRGGKTYISKLLGIRVLVPPGLPGFYPGFSINCSSVGRIRFSIICF